tara:strand:+ start:914 stop:1258 length:345 start_codon:yes stop_codon:yes gene_type:complete
MICVSSWKLAPVASNARGLVLIVVGSMYPDILRIYIQKCKNTGDKPFGVNVRMLYPHIELLMAKIIEEGIKIVFTSLGNPKNYTCFLKDKGIAVLHAVSSIKFALKAQASGIIF